MHTPVMLAEVLDGLAVREGGRYIDATLGDAGHASAVLERIGPEGRLLGIDQDPAALAVAEARLAERRSLFVMAKANFSEIGRVAAENGFRDVDGVLFDLGVRSDQLDRAERGFSFQSDGPLDMRMDPDGAVTAADIVNRWPEADVADALWTLGGERASRRIAAAIARRRRERPFLRTLDLASVAGAAAGGRRGRIHPATRTFMALRMMVNRELESIESGLEAAIGCLRAGGRLVVLSYHSVEDRVVKTRVKAHVGRWISLEAGGETWQGEAPRMEWVHRKVLSPGPDEQAANARSRSAKLRVAERSER